MKIQDQPVWIEEILSKGSEIRGISGCEHDLAAAYLNEVFAPLAEMMETDVLGNYYFRKTGEKGQKTVLLAAHADEIGFMVTAVDPGGFIRFTAVGGVDVRSLPCQEVLVCGRKDLPGVICFSVAETKDGEVVPMEKLAVDVGMSRADVLALVRPGDPIIVRRKFQKLLNGTVSGKALDDRAGIAALAVCLAELKRLRHDHDVVAAATSQEEVGCRGAQVAAFRLLPALAVVVDVTHAQSPDAKQVNVQLSKGPVITRGPNLHPLATRALEKYAKEARIPVQIDVSPRATGTDARVIQLQGQGTPTVLVGIPLRYMHTPVETVSLLDVELAGKLLAGFIASLSEDLEELRLCY